jgi:hypothetical protein
VWEFCVRRKKFGGPWWRHIPRSTDVALLSDSGQPDSSDAQLCGELPARKRNAHRCGAIKFRQESGAR